MKLSFILVLFHSHTLVFPYHIYILFPLALALIMHLFPFHANITYLYVFYHPPIMPF